MSPAVLQAKKDAESKGYVFFANRDEILAGAKKEGELFVLSSLNERSFEPMKKAFIKKYPFINTQILEIGGSEGYQRFLLEIKAGSVTEFDTSEASTDFYNEFSALARKIDILGMAQHGILKINPRMVDPNSRNLVAVASTVCAMAFNKKLISPEKVPDRWEDLLKPEFKGRKFLVDIRPQCMGSMMAGKGEEWVVNFARKLKDQEPIWVRGNTRALTAISAGEYALHHMTFWHSCIRASRVDPTKSLQCKIIEPAPVFLRETQYVLPNAPHPHAALLFIEHMASVEGQKVIDISEPLKSSLYAEGEVAKLMKGKNVIVNDYRTFQNMPKWMTMVVEAYGFPRAERRRR